MTICMIALARREGNAAKLSKKIRADPKLELNPIFSGNLASFCHGKKYQTPELHKDKPIVVNPTRVDPYKNFKFHVTFGGKIVATAKTASGIPRKITGMNKSTDITLKRGVIGDSGFSDWVKQVSAGTARLQRKNLILELHDEIGNKTSSWTLGNCRVSSFKPLPSLDKKAGTIAIETLVIQSESLKLNP